MKNKGFLISFEGVDKSGKSSQIDKLKQYLLNKGRNVETFGCLHGLPSVDLIGNIILNKKVDKIDAITELLLYQAARRELIVNFIKPALETNKIIILDRYIESTLVYQGILRNINFADIDYLNKLTTDNIVPNVTFLLKVSKKNYIERMQNTEITELDKIEIDAMYEYELLNEGFEYVSHLKDRVITIPDNSSDIVFEQIKEHIKFL